MTTFALVHGAWHGAWCWEKLTPMLQARGHDVVTPEYPCDDGSATLHDYADAVAASIPPSGDIILVGHSLGGAVIPLVVERVRARGIVFVCGVLPALGGLPWDDGPQMDTPGIVDPLVRSEDGSTRWPSVEAASAAMYGTCSADDAAWAFKRLRAQNSSSLWSEPYPLSSWPDVSVRAIATTDDRMVTIEWSRWATRNRFGMDPIELPGDHSPFLSRPDDLASILDDMG